jgi:hypothetical protein
MCFRKINQGVVAKTEWEGEKREGTSRHASILKGNNEIWARIMIGRMEKREEM